MMRILVATDAWTPQVNGVVNTLQNVARVLAERNAATFEFLTPQGFATVPLPTYPEIRLALVRPGTIARRIAAQDIDHIHIATEGPIGMATRRACLHMGRAFTTSFHTRFPEYIQARWGLPARLSYAWLRRFHAAGIGTMVPTPSIRDALAARGFANLALWSRGADHAVFKPTESTAAPWPRPIFIAAGRVAPEKNLEAFLALDLPGTKIVAGDGPVRAHLQARYPQAVFLGYRTQPALAALFADADVFVFPSRTDTFGIVLVEALACGLPVAAFPVAGPLDVIGTSEAGVLSEDLRAACLQALTIDRAVARRHALRFTWDASAQQFLRNIAVARERSVVRSHSDAIPVRT